MSCYRDLNPGPLPYQGSALPLSYNSKKKSGRRGSNPRPSAWKANALSTELLPQKYTVSESLSFRRRPASGPAPSGLCNSNRHSFFSSFLWEVMDSNHRRRKPADLQSAPFGHSGNFPCLRPSRNMRLPFCSESLRIGLSRWRDSNPRPADYKSAALAN